MRYRGGGKKKPFRAVVGKGVMFDTGGYNLKPPASMEAMKSDMAGAAAVMGLMKSLALRKSRVNVIGVCGCAVNLVSDKAYLPSAVIRSYKGLTVEIGNTDAEGRLVLADAMAYVIERENPSELIDLATLTGSCMVALGGQYAGLFSTNERMANGLVKAGEQTGERLWRLPVDDSYAAKPRLADVNNDGKRYGGASTAAVFLKRFVGDTPWAHLDIAGVALSEKIPEPLFPVKGATGFGVRLLVNYLERNTEVKE
jgi:leucyl aminopeptidase